MMRSLGQVRRGLSTIGELLSMFKEQKRWWLISLNQTTRDWYIGCVTLGAAKGPDGQILRFAQHDTRGGRTAKCTNVAWFDLVVILSVPFSGSFSFLAKALPLGLSSTPSSEGRIEKMGWFVKGIEGLLRRTGAMIH